MLNQHVQVTVLKHYTQFPLKNNNPSAFCAENSKKNRKTIDHIIDVHLPVSFRPGLENLFTVTRHMEREISRAGL